MSAQPFGKRTREQLLPRGFEQDLGAARQAGRDGDLPRCFDLYEQVAEAHPQRAIAVLAELHDVYRALPRRDRWTLYQSRHLHLGLRPGDQVLDVGSGHLPFPFATHLADITLDDHGYGRAGIPFQQVEGKPVFRCSVEKLPFADGQFDFSYCSHTLEHTTSPEAACRELMRVSRRGYIECPSPGKDVFLASARPSHHVWAVEAFEGRLVFSEYTPEQIEGLGFDLLQQMHSSPRTEREKAFSALVYLRAEAVNTMLFWEGSFEFEVRRLRRPGQARAAPPTEIVPAPPRPTLAAAPAPAATPARPSPPQATVPARPLRFLQVHTFYPGYLRELRAQSPGLSRLPFADQVTALLADGFSGTHMIAPYLARLGYQSQLVVANDPAAQVQWLREQGLPPELFERGPQEVVRRQVEALKPDVLYLSDPIGFDGRFLATLTHRPALVLGWRAASIPEGTDWRGFDVMLSSLAPLRQVALELGARSAEAFHPGYPAWINEHLEDVQPQHDLVFSGQWTRDQHASRNRYLERLAARAAAPGGGFTLGLYLAGDRRDFSPEVARLDLGPRFGVEMHRALRTGRIAFDARATHAYRGVDLGGRDTANMRTFEVTGSGVMLLAEHHDNLGELFEPGREIETFRDERELLQKIRHYLDHPAEREAIARRGQERCLRDHGMERRAEAFDGVVRRHLPAPARARVPEVGSGAGPGEALRLREEAARLIEQGRHPEAFDLLARAKALRQPLEGLDLLRALCFEHMGQEEAARMALLEELRFFPGNAAARQRLEARPAAGERPAATAGEDPEFAQLFRIVRPYTMLSEARLRRLHELARRACAQGIPGNFAECGVAAGGSSALLAYVARRHGKGQRRVFSFDTFSGMPTPTAADRHAGQDAEASGWGTGTCAAPEESVRQACAQVGAAEVLTTVPGLFEATLPVWRDRVGMLALLHLDGDWYESTRAILDHLYDRVSEGGLLQVDDYGHWEGCQKALHEFEASRGLRFGLERIDGTGGWFARPDRFVANPDLPAEAVANFEAVDPVPCGAEGQMSVNERFQLFLAAALLPRRARPLRFVEIGSYAGASLALTYMALRRAGAQVSGFSVDPGGHPGLLQVLKAIGPDVTHLQELSHQAAPRLARTFADGNLPELIFVDGDHTYPGVRQDILDYYPLLAPGGIIAFHDWLPPLDDRNREAILAHHAGQEPGIRRACAEVLEERHGLAPLHLPLLRPGDPTQTQAHLPIIPGVFSTFRAYRKPEVQ